jgi:hypothetical protein
MARITPSQYAASRKLQRSTISRQIRAGKIRIDKAGKVDPEQADRDRAANLDGTRKRQQARRKAGGRDTRTIAAIQAKREGLRLRRDEMAMARLEGKLVDAEKVRQEVELRASSEKQALLNLPARYSATLAGELGIDEKVLRSALDRIIRLHLTERSGSAGIDS